MDENIPYHYVTYNIKNKNKIVEEEKFNRFVKPLDKGSRELINEFFNKSSTVYQHPDLTISNKKIDYNKDNYSELFNDQFISTIYLTGDLDQLKSLDNAHMMDKPVIPSLNVTATIITPYSVRKYKDLLLEINTYADLLNTDVYLTTYYSNKYYFRNHHNPKKSSYFLSYKNYSSFESISPLDPLDKSNQNTIFNKTSIQLISTSSDNLMIRNKMYTDMCNILEIPSAQVAFTRIYFNDIPIGFYLIKENPSIEYFKEKYSTSEMYGQMNSQYSQMNYVGDFKLEKRNTKLLKNATTDNYSNYWYQGIEKPEPFHSKDDLASLFKLFKAPTSLNDIVKHFEIHSFLKNMALDYVVSNEHGYLYNGTNFFLYYDTVSLFFLIFIKIILYNK